MLEGSDKPSGSISHYTPLGCHDTGSVCADMSSGRPVEAWTEVGSQILSLAPHGPQVQGLPAAICHLGDGGVPCLSL